MDEFENLRSGQQQMNDELHAAYKRLTDPDEIERERIKKRRQRFTTDMQNDAGL